MTAQRLQTAISAGFKAFGLLDKHEQEAVLEALAFIRVTIPRPAKDWDTAMLAHRLIKEDAARRSK